MHPAQRLVPSAATVVQVATTLVVFLATDLVLIAAGVDDATPVGPPLKGAALLGAAFVGSRVGRRFRLRLRQAEPARAAVTGRRP